MDKKTAIKLVCRKGIFRARDAAESGVSSMVLKQMVETYKIKKLGRGIYAPIERMQTESDHLAEIAIRYPNAIFCLLTALQIHELTSQSPHEIWVAVASKARAPQADHLPIRVVRFSGDALTAGIEQVSIDGIVQIPVTCVAKTVADCFKFRNKIGLDVALEALREAWHGKKASMDELWAYAEICRVQNVMRPYLESLV